MTGKNQICPHCKRLLVNPGRICRFCKADLESRLADPLRQHQLTEVFTTRMLPTPRALPDGRLLATGGKRLFAGVIDLWIIIAVSTTLLELLNRPTVWQTLSTLFDRAHYATGIVYLGDHKNAARLLWTAQTLVGGAAALLYWPLFEGLLSGRTPGKWVAGLAVENEDGGPISFLQASIRGLLRWALLVGYNLFSQYLLLVSMEFSPLLASLIPLLILGWAVLGFTPRFFYERMTDTVVIDVRRTARAGILPETPLL